MSAVQLWTFLRYLPRAIANVVPDGNATWLFLLQLMELVDMVFAQKFTDGMIAYLKLFIEDHLTAFQKVFPGVGLKPRHHFVIHYPSLIRKFGTLYYTNCLKYELQNSFFKRSSHIVCNFKNIYKAFAYRNQCMIFYNILSGKTVRNFVIPSNILQLPGQEIGLRASIKKQI